jgi:predicted GNAT family N-acyltransferase
MNIIEPSTSEEFEKYYQLRWEVLRAPWGKPKGSEKDDMEAESIHGMAVDNNGDVLAVVRLNKSTEYVAQIRFMGVKTEQAGKGIGSILLNYMEKRAKEAGYNAIILHARENALEFYKRNNYLMVEKSYLMWDEIQHYLMKKEL